jgi:hypothetical protein
VLRRIFGHKRRQQENGGNCVMGTSYEECGLLGCNEVKFGESLTFWRDMSPPYSVEFASSFYRFLPRFTIDPEYGGLIFSL